MRVVWTPEAEQDRLAIWDYIAAESQGQRRGWIRFSASARADWRSIRAWGEQEWFQAHPN